MFLYKTLFLMNRHSFTCSFVLFPGPQYVSLLAHASIVAGRTGYRSGTLSTGQAECLCLLEFCLGRRVSPHRADSRCGPRSEDLEPPES
jgi:hypothetical protein